MQHCFKFLCTISLVGVLGTACKKEGMITLEKPASAASTSGSSCGKFPKPSKSNGNKGNKTVESLAYGTHQMAVIIAAFNKNAIGFSQRPGSGSSNSSSRRTSSSEELNKLFRKNSGLYPSSTNGSQRPK